MDDDDALRALGNLLEKVWMARLATQALADRDSTVGGEIGLVSTHLAEAYLVGSDVLVRARRAHRAHEQQETTIH